MRCIAGGLGLLHGDLGVAGQQVNHLGGDNTQADTLHAVGLDVPQPTALCTALRAYGIDLPEGILTPEECAAALSKLIQ